MSDDWQFRQLFEKCIDLHSDSLYRVAFRLTGDRDKADELLQETYLAAWKNIGSLKDHTKIRSWMFAILRNQVSKSRRRVPIGNQSSTPMEELAITDVMCNDQQAHVQAVIERLPDEQKLPLLLVNMEGLAVDEVAQILGIPRGTVLSRLHRGREKLRRMLRPDDFA